MGINYQTSAELGGLSRSEIMAAREEDAQRLRASWSGIVDRTAPGFKLVAEVDRIFKQEQLDRQRETKEGR
jgi:hypothetical protein